MGVVDDTGSRLSRCGQLQVSQARIKHVARAVPEGVKPSTTTIIGASGKRAIQGDSST